MSALRGRDVSGPELELRQHLGLNPGEIPVDLFEPEKRVDVASAPPATGLGVNVDLIRPKIYARSVAGRLGVAMPRVGSGTYSTMTVVTGLSAVAVAAGTAAESTAATLTPLTSTPFRISARLSIRLEDVATIGVGNFESVLRQNLMLAMSDRLDHYLLTGNDTDPIPKGLLTGLTAVTDPTTVVDWKGFVSALSDGIDGGPWAEDMTNVRLCVNAETMRLAETTLPRARGHGRRRLRHARRDERRRLPARPLGRVLRLGPDARERFEPRAGHPLPERHDGPGRGGRHPHGGVPDVGRNVRRGHLQRLSGSDYTLHRSPPHRRRARRAARRLPAGRVQGLLTVTAPLELAAPLELRVSGRTLRAELPYNTRARDRAEMFAPGSIRPLYPVTLHLQHDASLVLATTADRSLRMADRPQGLTVEAELPAGVLDLVRSGALTGISPEFFSRAERRTAGVRILEAADLPAFGLVDRASYATPLELRAIEGAWLAATIPTGHRCSCECAGRECDAVIFDPGSLDELVDGTADVVAHTGKLDPGSILGSKAAGSLLVRRTAAGVVVALTEPATPAAAAVRAAGAVSAIHARPLVDLEASASTVADRVRTYTAAAVSAILVKTAPPGRREGWEPAVIEGADPEARRRLWL